MADPALRAEIAKGTTLQTTETNDRSAPVTNPRGAILGDIAKGADLKHAETADKSAPVIESDVKVKKIDRSEFLTEVTGDHKLSHVETDDKSAPQTDGATVKMNQHSALHDQIKSQTH